MYFGSSSCQDDFGRKKCYVNLMHSIMIYQKLRNSISLKQTINFSEIKFQILKLYLSKPQFFKTFLSDDIVSQKLPSLENTVCLD